MNYKFLGKVVIFSVLIGTSYFSIIAQDNDSLIQKRINSRQYFFVPKSASSALVTMSVTTEDYGVRVTKDSIIAVLPYNGRSYTVQSSPSEREIKFTSTNFKYTSVAKKNGKWEITITPKDVRGVELYLSVFNDGTTRMQVISPDNETMTFMGYVW